MQNNSVSGDVKPLSELSNEKFNGDEEVVVPQRSIAELRAERELKAECPAAIEITPEDEFLALLLRNLQRPFLYWLSPEEKTELKRIGLLHGEAVCERLSLEVYPTPVTYVSKKGYYIMKGIVAISLATGRFYLGKKPGRSDGDGDLIETWALFRNVNFPVAVRELTEFLIGLRAREARQRASLNREKVPLDELKRYLWQAFEKRELIVGEKVLFPKGEGKRMTWVSAGGVFEILREVYGEACAGSDYFASPAGVRALLDLWVESGCAGLFRVDRRWRPKGVVLAEARQIEFAFYLSGIYVKPFSGNNLLLNAFRKKYLSAPI